MVLEARPMCLPKIVDVVDIDFSLTVEAKGLRPYME